MLFGRWVLISFHNYFLSSTEQVSLDKLQEQHEGRNGVAGIQHQQYRRVSAGDNGPDVGPGAFVSGKTDFSASSSESAQVPYSASTSSSSASARGRRDHQSPQRRSSKHDTNKEVNGRHTEGRRASDVESRRRGRGGDEARKGGRKGEGRTNSRGQSLLVGQDYDDEEFSAASILVGGPSEERMLHSDGNIPVPNVISAAELLSEEELQVIPLSHRSE